MPTKDQLPYALYTAEQVRRLDQLCIQQYGIDGNELMEKAGKMAFESMMSSWPGLKKISVVAGTGNNAGDGFVVARLAIESGIEVEVIQLGDTQKISGEAKYHKNKLKTLSTHYKTVKSISVKTDLIVDAILGTGLTSIVEGEYKKFIDLINAHQADVFALDIPSGLNANTGIIMGSAIRANKTISFIGLKQGMMTGVGPECCGDITFHALDIPAKVYSSEILNSRRIDWLKLKHNIIPRKRHAHKGDFGHVLVIGGAVGFSGAVLLAGEAAARSGAGLISIATHFEHYQCLNNGCPELMVHPVEVAEDIDLLLERASVVVLGPGLGQSSWSKNLFQKVWQSKLPLVLDADGLNILASSSMENKSRSNMIITPHPGEASRLLNCSIQEIESNRFKAIEKLQRRFACTVVLKGAGSLVCSNNKLIAVCSDGNPGMASGGMGDVLSGVLGAMLAQNHDLDEVACLSVSLHSAAADIAAKDGEIGLLAHDLFKPLRILINA